jgi:sirohydrochlorin ferrochelatase
MARLRSPRVREVVFLVVGASTPIGILAVNGSAFIMQHLREFRAGIAVCALISGLSLNGVTAWAALERAGRYVPQLVAEYRSWLIAAIAAFVIVFSALGAFWTYDSLDQRLPNGLAVLSAIWLLILPVLLAAVARRFKVRAARAERAPGPERLASPPPRPSPARGEGE